VASVAVPVQGSPPEETVPQDPPDQPFLAPPPRWVPLTLLYDCLLTGLSCGGLAVLLGAGLVEGYVLGVLWFPGPARIVYVLGGLVSALILLVGIGLLIEGMRLSLRECWFLRRGKLTLARATDHAPCDRTRGQRVTLEFTTDRGEVRQAQVSTHNPAVLEPSHRTLILYDPDRPDRSLIVEDMKCEPRFNGRGGYRAPEAGFLALIPFPVVLLSLLLVGCLLEWLGIFPKAGPH
jgi:hypothetical protein